VIFFSESGVSHLPAIRHVNISKVFHRLQSTVVGVSQSPSPIATIAVVVASDGIWDNWTYEDVTKFVMDESCLKAVLPDLSVVEPSAISSLSPTAKDTTEAPPAGSPVSLRGIQRVANSFIKRNGVFARKNFGNDADNATGVVIYLNLLL
jgi:hypothetical protein